MLEYVKMSDVPMLMVHELPENFFFSHTSSNLSVEIDRTKTSIFVSILNDEVTKTLRIKIATNEKTFISLPKNFPVEKIEKINKLIDLSLEK